MDKPITVLRDEYIRAICDISNNSGLPAFVMLEVIERTKSQLEQMAHEEYLRDLREYKSSQSAGNAQQMAESDLKPGEALEQTPIGEKGEKTDADECV